MKLGPERNSSGGASGSLLARCACAACAALIVYGSLTPWNGWRDAGVGAFAYLTAPLPRYITSFDLVVNVLAYLPLGGLTVLALYPRQRGVQAAAIATLLGVALSAGLEALQTFLPSRVASNVDLAANGIGTLLGASLAAPFAETLIDRGAMARLAMQWITRDAAPALVLLALWPIAQIDPGPMLFGNGRAAGAPLLPAVVPMAQTALTAPPEFGPSEFILAEALVTVCGLLAAGLALASTLRPRAPRVLLLAALCAAALLAKALAYGVKFGPEYALAWATPGALGGLALGSICLLVAVTGRASALSRVSTLCLCALVIAVNVIPANPYHAAWIEQWQPGKLRHFNAAAAWLSTAWPYAMLAWLAYDGLLRRTRRTQGA